MVSLVAGAWPAIQEFGFGFLFSQAWRPTDDRFGALASIYGTIVTSLLAMLLAVPVGIGIAIFLTELCPRPLRRPIGIAIELLAGIPSIIYGIWGLFIFAPWFQVHVQQPVIKPPLAFRCFRICWAAYKPITSASSRLLSFFPS